MKAALPTTLLMGLIAAVAVAGAIYWYPKSAAIVVDATVNQNLFETYETSDVRSISITHFSDDSNRMEQFALRRKGERWVIPGAGDFPATRIARIGEVAKSLLDRKVLALQTKDEQGHVEFGVVDPTESKNSPNRSSLGMRVDLQDRNRIDIASLIIGNVVKDGSKGAKRYYVRVPGQPAVYELEIPKQIFSTRFQDWVDPNLLELPPPGVDEVSIAQVFVDQYRLDPEKLADAKRENVYRSRFDLEKNALKETLFESWKDDEFSKQEVSESQQQELLLTLRSLGNIRYIDVIGKPKSVAKLLRDPSQDLDKSKLEPLQQFGFRASEEGQLEASNGERVRLLVGSLAQRADSENLDLHFHGMLLAQLEESVFADQLPEKPEDVAEDSSENKAYLRAKEKLDRQRASALLRIEALNRNWSKWIYVIPETTINAIRPDVTL